MGFSGYLQVSVARISIVFSSVLRQIGQKDMGFSGYLQVSVERISIVFLSVLRQKDKKTWDLVGTYKYQ